MAAKLSTGKLNETIGKIVLELKREARLRDSDFVVSYIQTVLCCAVLSCLVVSASF